MIFNAVVVFFFFTITMLCQLEILYFPFFGNSSVFHFNLGFEGLILGLAIVGTVPFATFLVPDKVFMIWWISKCSEHTFRYIESNSLSARGQRRSFLL